MQKLENSSRAESTGCAEWVSEHENVSQEIQLRYFIYGTVGSERPFMHESRTRERGNKNGTDRIIKSFL